MSLPHTKRICQIIKLKPEAESVYKAIHAVVWPGVLASLARHHIADFSIHYYAPIRLLIANFKYTGADYDADMRGMADDGWTQLWWKLTDSMQESMIEGATGSGGEVPWWTVNRSQSLDRSHFAQHERPHDLRRPWRKSLGLKENPCTEVDPKR